MEELALRARLRGHCRKVARGSDSGDRYGYPFDRLRCHTSLVWPGTISGGEEGDAPRRRRGDIPVRRLAVRGDDGESLEAAHAPLEGSTDHRFHSVREIESHSFDRCPICLSPDPISAEHLPPAALGGRSMTRTCSRCNNDLGRIEAELIDWRDNAYRHTTATSDAIVGARKLPRLLHRQTPDGKFVLIVDGPIHPDAEPMLKGLDFALQFVPPNPRLYKLAALKHAFLAACLELRAIPQTPCADLIRGELLAARDAPSRKEIPGSDYALSMPLMRTHEHPCEPSVMLGHVRRPDGLAEWWISLAGTIAVPWPLPDAPPAS
jgi:hypothetical protein